MVKKYLRVREAAELLGLCTSAVYRALSNNEIRSIRVGRILLIPEEALNDMLSEAHGKERVQ